MSVISNNEDFTKFEAKVNEVVKLLEGMNMPKKTPEDPKKPSNTCTNNEIQDKNCIALVKEASSGNCLNRQTQLPELSMQNEMDKYTFMEQLEKDAQKRFQIRKDRQQIAQDFRKRGNDAFHEENYERAAIMYTKAINHIRDSPILYNNRALTFIKLKAFKRALMDCDYVLNKLDEKNLRSWLYRSIAYKQLNDEKNYENSINMAKKHNPKKTLYIENFQVLFFNNTI